MKTKTLQALAVLATLAAAPAFGADVIKTNNSDALNLGSSWVGGVSPTAADIGVWNNTVLGDNTAALGANINWLGLKIVNPGGQVTLSAGNTLTLGGSGINMSAATTNLTLNNALTLGAAQTWTVGGTQTLSVNGPISATTAINLTKTGSGTLNLSGTVTNLGTINLSVPSSQSGALGVLSGANISATSLALFQNSVTSGTLNYNQTGGSVTLANELGLGASSAGGDSGCINTATISGGTLTANTILYLYKWATSTLTVSGPGVVNAASLRIGWVDSSPTGTINLGDGTTFSGGTSILDGGTSGLLKVNAWSIQSVRNYTLNLKGGTLKAGATSASWLTAGAFATATVQDAGGIIDNGGFAITIAQVFNHGGSTAIDGGMVFKGAGATTLTGANGYTGPTVVGTGILYANSPLNFGSPISVGANATFGGKSTNGAVTVAAGGLIEGGQGGSGSLTLSNLTFNGTGTIKVSAAAQPYVPLAVTNTLTLNGTVTILIGNAVAPGTYHLAQWGALAGGGGFTLLPTRTYSLATNGNYLDVVVAVSPGNDLWTGAGSSEWSTATGLGNWKLSADNSAIDFLTADPVVFNDSSANPTVNISVANVSPSTVTFDNTNNSYVLNGPYAIASGSLIKTGPGTVTINNVNTYAGGTTVSNGTVAFVGGGLGGGTVTVAGNATLRWLPNNSLGLPFALSNGITATLDTSTNTVTQSTALGGTGTVVVKAGPGRLTLGAAGSYSGGTTLSAGTLAPTVSAGAGTGTVTLGDANTGTNNVAFVAPTAGLTFANNFVVSANGTGTATIGTSGGSGVETFNGSIALSRDVILKGSSSDRTTFNGAITGTGNLTIDSSTTTIAGRVTIASNSFAGTTTVLPASCVQLNSSANTVFPDAYDVTNHGTIKLNISSTEEIIGGLQGTNTAAVLQNHEAVGGTPTLTFGGGDRSGSYPGAIVTGSGTFSLSKTGTGTQTLSGTLTYNGSTTVNNGTLRLANITSMGSSGVYLNAPGLLELSNSVTTTFSRVLNGYGDLVKTGSGTVTLASTNSGFFYGPVAVTGGTLNLTGDLGNPSFVTINSGATLNGSGVVSGAVTNNNGGTIAALNNAVFTLNGAGLTLGNAATDNTFAAFSGDGAGMPGYWMVNSPLTLNGTNTVSIGGVPPAVVGSYVLIKYNAGFSGTGTFALSPLPVGYAGYLTNDTTAGELRLVVTAVDSLLWVGWPNNNWDLAATNKAWKLASSGTPVAFVNGAVVGFDDSASNFVANLTAAVKPSAVALTAGKNYTLTGLPLQFTGSLIKDGAGALTLTSTNSLGALDVRAGTVVAQDNNTAGNVTLTSGTLQLGIGGTNGWVTLPASLSLGNNDAVLAFNRSDDLSVGTTFGGLGALRQLGGGTLALSGANDYSGGTLLSRGTIRGANVSVLGTGPITLGDTNTGSSSVTLLYGGLGGGTGPANDIVVTTNGTGTVTLGSYAGPYQQWTANLTLNRPTTFTDATGDRTTFTGVISGNVGTITIAGNRVTFANAGNNFVGNLAINSGSTFQDDSPAALPDTTSVNADGAFRLNNGGTHPVAALNGSGQVFIIAGGAATLSLGNSGGSGAFSGSVFNNAGVLSLNKEGAGTQTLSGAGIAYTGGTTINDGTLKLVSATGFASDVTMNTPTATLELNNSDSWNFAPAIAGAGPLVKTGTGRVSLTQDASHAGGTLVQAGTLLVAGLSGVGAVSVSAAAQFGGQGAIAGAVTVHNGGALAAPNNALLSLNGGLTLGASSTDVQSLNFSADGTLLAGRFDVSATGFAVNGTNIVNVTGLLPAIYPGTYTLVTYVSGTKTGSGLFVVGTLPARASGHIVDTGSEIDLVVTAANPLLWVGTPTNSWDFSGNLVWKFGGGAPAAFSNNVDVVNFDDSASNYVVNVSAGVNPMVAIINAASNYTFQGSPLVFSAPLLKTNVGTATLLANGNSIGALSLQGGTLVSKNTTTFGTVSLTGGTLQADNGGNTGVLNLPATTDIGAGATIAYDRNDVISIGTTFTGNGSLRQMGAGTLTLTSAGSAFGGGVAVSQGTLQLDTASAAGSGTVRLGDAATGANAVALVANAGSANYNNSIEVSTNGSGLVTLGGNQNYLTFAGLITLNRPTSLGGTAGDRYGYSGPISGNVGTLTVDALRVTLDQTSPNDFAGTVVINSGRTLQLNTSYGLSATNAVTVNGIFRPIAPDPVTIGSLNGPASGQVHANSGGGNHLTTLALGGDNGNGNYDGTIFNGSAGDTLAITKIGTGTQTFSGANTYTGATTVSNGTLVVNGSLATASAVYVAPGATFGGSGTSGGPVIVDGILSPGASPGALTISNTLTLGAGSTTFMEINRATSVYDQVNGVSTITFDGALIVTNLAGTFSPGDTFHLFNATTYQGTFAAVQIYPATPAAGLSWDTSQLVSAGLLKVSGNAAPAITGLGVLPDHNCALTLTGALGQPYTVWASTNVALPLAGWQNLGSGTLSVSPFLYQDLTATNYPRRFYRTSAP
jgi:autotransporter-associated beta strand protein